MIDFAVERGERVGPGGCPVAPGSRNAEQGYVLVGLIVAIFCILLVLSIAGPRVAQELKRERELEAMQRGNQYVRAIQLFYRKTQGYPASMEALQKTNNVRFLRQAYVDPMTGKADWRLIHVGEAKTTVKGFFGQPLAGMAPGLGSAAGMASPGGTGTAPGAGTGSAFGGSTTGGGGVGSSFGSGAAGASGGSAFGSSSGSSFGSSSGSSAFGSSSGQTSAFGGTSTAGGAGGSGAGSSDSSGFGTGSGTTGSGTTGTGTGGAFGQSGSGSGSGMGTGMGSGLSGGGAPFVGVGLPKAGDSIVVLNEQTSYQTWEFIYDPRIEQLKAKANLLGGGPAATDAGSLGSASGMSSGVGASPSGFGSGSGTGSAFGSGSSTGSGFGSQSGSGSGFGSSGSSGGTGFGSSGSSGNTPQNGQPPH